MKQYLNLLKHVLDNGTEKSDRTGTGTISVFGYQMRFDLSKGFPLVTTKNVPFRLIVSELLWFLSGSTNVKYLHDNNNHIWDEWIDENGDLGRIYSAQWRDWRGVEEIDINHPLGIKNVIIKHVDQLKNVIESIKESPYSRRHIVSAWNPAEIDQMALPPCHTLFQFYVANNKLSCQLFQRSSDLFLGAPFNIASYALLTHMIAHVTGLDVGEFIHTLGDAHIYKNHIEQVKLQLTREPYELPYVTLNPEVKSVFDFTIDDIVLHNYVHHPTIKGEVSI